MRSLSLFPVMVVAATAFADPDPAFEKKAHDEIAAVSADAVAAWDAANAARDAKRADDAAAGYRKAIALAPTIDHPHRRLCSLLASQQQIEAALAECEQAMRLAPTSPYDQSTYAATLLARNKPGDRQRIALAEKLAMPAERTSPDDAAPVWDLFSDPDQIERSMTAILRERIHKKRGIAISGDEWEDESPANSDNPPAT